jgi:hypothetical protein
MITDMTTTATTRTRRGSGFASPGAVKAQGETLPVYICNRCGREVVWAESKRTGRRYLVSVSRGYNNQRYYVGADLHSDEACAGIISDREKRIAWDEEQEERAARLRKQGDEVIARTLAEVERRLADLDRLS